MVGSDMRDLSSQIRTVPVSSDHGSRPRRGGGWDVECKVSKSRQAMMSLIGLLCALGATSGARGQLDSMWEDGDGGAWSDPANWSTVDFPNNNGTTYNAIIAIPGNSGEYIVTLDVPITIDGFEFTSLDARLDGLDTNTLEVLDHVLLTDAFIEGVPAFLSLGTLTFQSSICDDVCDTALVHTGPSAIWLGAGDIALKGTASFSHGAGSTFSILNARTLMADPGASFVNLGTIAKSSTQTTTVTGGTFANPGTLDVSAGTFSTDALMLVNNTLEEGTWIVRTGGTIDLVAQTIVTNLAKVAIGNPTSLFPAFDPVEVNGATGSIEINAGADFTTAGDFTNLGYLRVGPPSEFAVPSGSALTNYDPGTQTLSSGTFNIAGVLKFPGADIRVIDTILTLDEPSSMIVDDANNDALDMDITIANNASLRLSGGRSLTTGGNLTVAQNGTLRIDAGSTLTVGSSFVLTNLNGPILTPGRFIVQGTLKAPGASITTVQARLTLDTTGSMFVDLADNDALDTISSITSSGVLTFSGGRDQTLTSPGVSIAGQLVIGPSAGPDVSQVNAAGVVSQTAGSTLLRDGVLVAPGGYILSGTGKLLGTGMVVGGVTNGGRIAPGESPGQLEFVTKQGAFVQQNAGTVAIEIAGMLPGIEHDVVSIQGPLQFAGGNAGTLETQFIDGFQPLIGDVYDIVTYESVNGQFASVTQPDLPCDMVVTATYLPDRIQLGVEEKCVADCDKNGQVNILDFICFQSDFVNMTPCGDCDGNAVFNILDFVCFQSAFQAGCP